MRNQSLTPPAAQQADATMPNSTPPYAHRPAIVLGLARNGASVLRRLVALKCQAWGVDTADTQPGWSTSRAELQACPDPERAFPQWVDFMADLGAQFEDPPPLIPTSDKYVVALDQAAEQLRPLYKMHNFGSGLRSALTSKRSTFEFAERAGLAYPKTGFVRTREELSDFLAETEGEVLIKPDLPQNWRSGKASDVAAGRKVITGDDRATLLAEYDRIAQFSPEVVAQEIIPGPDEQLVYWCGFVGAEGIVGGRLVGRKHRIAPIHYGSATYVQLIDYEALEEYCEEFLTSLNYVGLCGIEFKEDPRDGECKLIEVNPRYSLWDDIGVPVGVDLVAEALGAFYGEPTIAHRPHHTNQKWVDLTRDVASLARYRREGLLSVGQWLRSLAPPIVVNDLPVWQDPRYAAAMVRRQISKLRGKA